MRGFVAIALLIFSMVSLCVAVSGPSNPVMERIMDTVLCRADEDITERLGPQTYEGQETDFLCEDSAGATRDVTLPAFGLMVAMFVVPFLVGLFMLINSGKRMVNSRMAAALETLQTEGMVLNPDSASPIVIDGAVFRQAVASGGGVSGGSRDMPKDLATRLAELQDARDQGLISSAEYDRMRRTIMDKFDD